MTLNASHFPLLQQSLAPEYSEASYEQLTGIVEAIYGPGSTPESVEGLFDDIGRGLRSAAGSVGHFVQQAAPVVARAIPNIVQGAATGASMGGPWGALIGGVAGGASGIMQQSNDPNVRGVGNFIHQAGSLAGSIRGGGLGGGGNALGSIGAGGQAGGQPFGNILSSLFGGGAQAGAVRQIGQTPASTGGAANGLMGMLTRPETLQALLSSGMGAFGNRSLQIGGQQVPVHTLLSALSTLAGRAASEAAEFAENAEATPVYIANVSEALGVNPESAEGRLETTLALLALTAPNWAMMRSAAPPLTVNVGQPDPTMWPVSMAVPLVNPNPVAPEFIEYGAEWHDFEWLAGGEQEMIDA